MEWLLIFFDPRPRAILASGLPVSVEELVIAGRRYRLNGGQKFFEWLFGEDGTVTGVEFRAEINDPAWCDSHGRPLATGLDESELFPRLWFSERRDGACRRLQDWEDYYYQTEDSQLLVALRTHMLNDRERTSLRELLSKPDRA